MLFGGVSGFFNYLFLRATLKMMKQKNNTIIKLRIMGWPIETMVSSTNPELISSGSTFIQKNRNDLYKISYGKAYFRSFYGNLEAELIRLSINHPEEVFYTTLWRQEDDYDKIKYSGIYRDGRYHEIAVEPVYSFCINRLGSNFFPAIDYIDFFG